jgi:hypothetical protein
MLNSRVVPDKVTLNLLLMLDGALEVSHLT